ncbi:MAG: hypothetical protein AAB321_00230 [Chloroflexota bacterium]
MRFPRGYAGRRRASTNLLPCAVLFASSIFAGCARYAEGTLPVPAVIETALDLTQALAAAGVTPTQSHQPAVPYFGVPGRTLRVGGSQVQVFEFENDQARAAVSQSIDPTGYAVGGQPVDWEGRPNIWAVGRLIVVYPGAGGGTVLLLSGLLGDPITAQRSDLDEPYPPAVLAAIDGLAEQSGSAPEAVEVVNYEAVEWPDGCLGLPDAGEACTEAITPGWRITLRLAGRTLSFRADALGTELRQE